MTDHAYWLRRKRASVIKANLATSAEARLAHYDLAGRYSVKAANSDPSADAMATAPPIEIDEAQLQALIPVFYQRVLDDALLGPVFDGAIADWDLHLDKLTAFWSSVMLTSGRYKGSPMAAHLKHRGELTAEMFDRGLALWTEVTNDRLPGAAATVLQGKAARIADSLKLALYFRIEQVPETPASAKIP